jgi:hypothetical protein
MKIEAAGNFRDPIAGNTVRVSGPTRQPPRPCRGRFSTDPTGTGTNIGAWRVLDGLQWSTGLARFDRTAGIP